MRNELSPNDSRVQPRATEFAQWPRQSGQRDPYGSAHQDGAGRLLVAGGNAHRQEIRLRREEFMARLNENMGGDGGPGEKGHREVEL